MLYAFLRIKNTYNKIIINKKVFKILQLNNNFKYPNKIIYFQQIKLQIIYLFSPKKKIVEK